MARYDRRTIIRGAGVALVGALAGCSDSGDGDGGSQDGTATETATETMTATATETMTATETTTATETVTETTTPTESGGGSFYTEQFRSVIQSELDVEITSLGVSGGTVKLVFETSRQASDAGGQIGYIGGAYAALVDEGWDTDELVGEFTDGEGARYRFRVESSVAQDYMDGNLTEDEFATAIFDSFERIDG